MVKRIGLIFFFLLILSACSNSQLTKNQVKSGQAVIPGGVFKNKTWDEKMFLTRTSWYRDFSLLFDSLLWKVEKSSKFVNWFSSAEKRDIASCDNFYVVLTYNLDADLLSNQDFFFQLREQGISAIEIPQFTSHLKLHPNYQDNSFQLYKIIGICVKANNSNGIKITFPGFHEITIN